MSRLATSPERSEHELTFLPRSTRLGVIADRPIALVGGLSADTEGIGDLLPAGTGVAGTSDEQVLAASSLGDLCSAISDASQSSIPARRHGNST